MMFMLHMNANISTGPIARITDERRKSPHNINNNMAQYSIIWKKELHEILFSIWNKQE